MPTPAHTAGQWKFDPTRVFPCIRMNGVVICNMVKQTTTSEEEYNANARLIAAAPLLLEACQAMHQWLTAPSPAQLADRMQQISRVGALTLRALAAAEDEDCDDAAEAATVRGDSPPPAA